MQIASQMNVNEQGRIHAARRVRAYLQRHGQEHPERKGYIMDSLVVPVED
jgi:hypothetical protein